MMRQWAPSLKWAHAQHFPDFQLNGPVQGPTYTFIVRGWTGAGTPETIVRRTAAYGGRVVSITDWSCLPLWCNTTFKEGQACNVLRISWVTRSFQEGSVWLHVANPQGYKNLCRFLTHGRVRTYLRKYPIFKLMFCRSTRQVCGSHYCPEWSRNLSRFQTIFGDRVFNGVICPCVTRRCSSNFLGPRSF